MTPKSLELTPVPYSFLRSQFSKPVPVPKDISLVGQTAIITGGNVGIGFHCAQTLLELGLSHLILAVRTPSKGEAAATKLKLKSEKATIEVWQVDMLSYKSVQAFAAKCKTLSRIDFVILNAGIVEENFREGPEGHEHMFQVNYLSTVLLASLLVPTLKQKAPFGKPGRLTIVNSGTGLMPDFSNAENDPFLAFFDDKSKFGMDSYPYSKALSHFWIVKFAERVNPDDVVVNLVDPGLTKGTSLHRSTSFFVKMIFSLVKQLTGRTMAQASSTFIDAAVVRGKETHGSFLFDWKIWSFNKAVYGSEGEVLRDRIWKETLAELAFVDINAILNGLRV